MKKIAFLIGALLVYNLIITSANAQSMPCGERTKVIEALVQDHSENPINMGLTNGGQVLEIYVSADRTFSVIVTSPAGVTCLIASGGRWAYLKIVLLGLDS